MRKWCGLPASAVALRYAAQRNGGYDHWDSLYYALGSYSLCHRTGLWNPVDRRYG